MASAHEIRELVAQTTTGTHRRRLPREVREEVRRYAERRRAQGATWRGQAAQGLR
jgi:hypothetical protein